MSTEIFQNILPLNIKSDYEDQIFNVLYPTHTYTGKLEYTFYDQSLVLDNKILEYDNYIDREIEFPLFSDISQSTSTVVLSPSILTSKSSFDLIESELENETKNETCCMKRKTIPKIDNIIFDSKSARKTSLDENDIITIGIYTRAERREKIRRYKQKRRNPVKKKILYQCRKRFADIRERVGGRFVKSLNK